MLKQNQLFSLKDLDRMKRVDLEVHQYLKDIVKKVTNNESPLITLAQANVDVD